MRALRAIRERKHVIEPSKWHDGKMPRTAFPLSKSHTYSLGSGWRWMTLRLQGDGRHYRLLVAYEQGKSQYQAWLGLESGADQALLARLEYHPSHRGWHCHLKKGPLDKVTCGIVRHPKSQEGVRLCEDDEFGISDANALGVACRIFNVEPGAAVASDDLFQ
jgi:hypothetical protein